MFQTPWDEEETRDLESLEKEIEGLLAERADGVVMAIVSETPRSPPTNATLSHRRCATSWSAADWASEGQPSGNGGHPHAASLTVKA